MGTTQYASFETADDTLTTTTETVVCTVSGVTTGRRQDIRLRGWAQLTTGTNTTAVTARIRRGTTITGTLIGEANAITIGAAAGSTEEFACDAVDPAVDMSSGSYVLTLQQADATANGSCLNASLTAEVTR